MKKADQIIADKIFLHGGQVFFLDKDRTLRYAYAHSLDDNLVLFGTSSAGVKIQASIHDCEASPSLTASQSPPEAEVITTTADTPSKPKHTRKKKP